MSSISFILLCPYLFYNDIASIVVIYKFIKKILNNEIKNRDSNISIKYTQLFLKFTQKLAK